MFLFKKSTRYKSQTNLVLRQVEGINRMRPRTTCIVSADTVVEWLTRTRAKKQTRGWVTFNSDTQRACPVFVWNGNSTGHSQRGTTCCAMKNYRYRDPIKTSERILKQRYNLVCPPNHKDKREHIAHWPAVSQPFLEAHGQRRAQKRKGVSKHTHTNQPQDFNTTSSSTFRPQRPSFFIGFGGLFIFQSINDSSLARSFLFQISSEFARTCHTVSKTQSFYGVHTLKLNWQAFAATVWCRICFG